MSETPAPEREVIYPEALCIANWQVLFENGDVFPVKYFLDKHGDQLPSSEGAHGIMFDAPNEKCFFVEISDIDIVSLH